MESHRPFGLGVLRRSSYRFPDPLPETVALIARMTTPPDRFRAFVIDELVRAMVDAGVWAVADAVYVLAAADRQTGRLNWKSTSYNLSEVNVPTFVVDKGFVGNKTNQALSTGFIPSSAGGHFTQNSASFGAFALAGPADAAGAQIDIGAQGGGRSAYSGRSNGAAELVAFNDPGATATVQHQGKVGLWTHSRGSAGAFKSYCGELLMETISSSSTGLPTAEFRILSSTAGFQTNRPVTFAFIGGALGDAQVSALSRAVDRYLARIESSALLERSFTCHGNSLTAGQGATAGMDYPAQLSAAIGANYYVNNKGTNGFRTPQLTAELPTPKMLVPSQYPSLRRTLIVWELRNQIVEGPATPAQAVASLEAYCQVARSLGWEDILVLDAIADGTANGMSPAIQAETNARLHAVWPSFADQIVKVSEDPRLQNPLNTTYYHADRLHLVDAGYTAVMQCIRSATGV